MRQYIIIVFCFCIIASGTLAAPFSPYNGYNTAVQALNPMASWQLNETSGTTAYDSTGSIHGTYVNSPTLNQPGPSLAGMPNDKAVLFNGSQDHVDIPAANFAFKNQSLSISSWVYITDNDNIYRSFISLGDGTSSSSTWINLAKARSGWNSGRIYFEIYNGTSSSLANSNLDGNNLPKNEWMHLTGVVDKANNIVKLYINGTLQLTSTLVNFDLTTVSQIQLHLGTFCFPYAQEHNSYLDEVAIYNYALSETQVGYLYGAAFNSAVPEPATFILLGIFLSLMFCKKIVLVKMIL